MSAQHIVDSLEFARRGMSLEGRLEVSSLSRLVDMLFSDKGYLDYSLSGFVSKQGKPRINLRVGGDLVLECQRCLEQMPFRVEIESILELVNDDEAFVPVEEEEDSIDLIPADSAMDVVALVEEEVMLALPVAPMHDGAACRGDTFGISAEKIQKDNPFAVLSSLKK